LQVANRKTKGNLEKRLAEINKFEKRLEFMDMPLIAEKLNKH